MATCESAFKAASHLTVFMRGMRAKDKIQRNNYQYRQSGYLLRSRLPGIFDRILGRISLNER